MMVRKFIIVYPVKHQQYQRAKRQAINWINYDKLLDIVDEITWISIHLFVDEITCPAKSTLLQPSRQLP